jgi:hypothetical protein
MDTQSDKLSPQPFELASVAPSQQPWEEQLATSGTQQHTELGVSPQREAEEIVGTSSIGVADAAPQPIESQDAQPTLVSPAKPRTISHPLFQSFSAL